MKLTDEQEAAVDTAASGTTFVLDAPAGSGKSHTCREMARSIRGRVLYLVYNRSARDDAQGTFPSNTTIKTTSQLAWHAYKKHYAERMDPKRRVKSTETARWAKIKNSMNLGEGVVIPPALLARLANETIDRFSYSADEMITGKHVVVPVGLETSQKEALKEKVQKLAWKIWLDSIQPKSPHRFTMSHAFKLLVMTNPQLGFDTVIVDEAQDSNEATRKLIQNQKSQQIIVGDPAQQIFQWRGAEDIMDAFNGPRLQLTQSFRFGEEIAEEATKWLEHTQTGITIRGLKSLEGSVVDGLMLNPDAILCRTNMGVMKEAIRQLEDGKKVAIVGGTKDLTDMAFAAIDLKNGRNPTHPHLAAFKDWDELVEFTEEPDGGDLKTLVGLILAHGSSALIDACKRMVDERRGNPDVVLSTSHKVKGRQWPHVKIHEDFASREPKPFENPLTGKLETGVVRKSDAMLHYVSVTRAQNELDRGGLAWIDNFS